MSTQAAFGWRRTTVKTDRDWRRLIGCREGLFRVKTTHQQGDRNLHMWRTHAVSLIAVARVGEIDI